METLPVNTCTWKSICSDEEVKKHIEKLKVLVVDEDEYDRNRICDILEKYGFIKDNLICCSSVEEANELIYIADIVFLEACERKGYNVFEFVTKWKNKGVDIFVSAYSKDLGMKSRSAAIYADQFVCKPLNTFSLMSAMDSWLYLSLLDFRIEAAKRNLSCHLKTTI